MVKKPIIGIPSAPRDMGLLFPVYSSNDHYVSQIAAAGGIPVQLPLVPGMQEEELEQLLALCDGLLLPGGGDFDPDWYGQTLLPNLTPDDSAICRESQSLALCLTRAAARRKLPILGICLGCQVINVAFGGTLIQDIPSQIPSCGRHSFPMEKPSDRWAPAHTIHVWKHTLLRGIIIQQTIEVNSFHHQAVQKVAPGFLVSARAPDGVIEAIESSTQRILGVQWHPENLSYAGIYHGQMLFRWLVSAAGNHK